MNTILEQINSAGFVFVKFAVPMLVQSAVLIVVLLLADLLLRKKVRAVVRYWLWMLVLLKLILPTTLSSPVSLGSWFGDELASIKVSDTSLVAQPVNSPQITETGTAAVAGAPLADVRPTVTPSPGAEPVVAKAAASPVVSPAPLSRQGIVFLVWAAVVAAMGLLLLQRAVFVTGLVAQAQNPTQLMNDAFRFCCGQMGIKGKVGLKVSANTASPAVCGLFRPVILLPQNLAPALGSSRLRPVLLHELAHIRRGDLWINLAQTILQIIYFYNPLLWLANSIIRRIREQAVDEAVQVAMGANAPQYPQTLVDVAKMAFNRPALSLRLIGVVESKSALKARIKRMLNRPIPKTAKLGILGLVTLIIVGCMLLPMANAAKDKKSEVEDTTRFIAKLDGSVTVELIGVCEYPSEGKQWWRPDGTYLKEQMYVKEYVKEDEDHTVSVKGKAFVLVVKVNRPMDSNFNWGSIEGARSVELLQVVDSGYQPIMDMEAFKPCFDERQTTTSIDIAVAAGDWTTQVRTDGKNIGVGGRREGSTSFGYSRAYESEKGVDITVSHGLVGVDERIVALDSEGNILGADLGKRVGGPGWSQVTASFEGLSLEQIKEFAFQTRPFKWVEFKNVSLRPGLKTDVQVDIEGADKVSDKDKMASENLAAEGTSGREPEKIVEQAVMTISTCAETDPRVEQSLKSLQGLDENAVVKELVKFLDSDKNTVRRSAIYILWKGNFKSIEPAVPGLQKLCSHEEEYTRGMAALALGARKVEPAFDTLCNMTLNDSSPYARRCAAYALGLLGRADAKPILEKAMKDSDFNVRNNAEAALTMLSQVEKSKSTQPETDAKAGLKKEKPEKTSQINSPPEQRNPAISVYPPSGSKIALFSELQVVFDQPMMPEEFKIVDASLEENFKDFSDVAVVRSYVVYDADKYQFSIPLILPCNWNGSVQLGGFKTAKGVEVKPIVLNYTTSRDKFSGDLLQRFEKAQQSRELRKLLENIKNARSRLKSLSETVYSAYDFGDHDEKSNKAIFKMQGRNQFYVDMSEEFEKPWHIGSDGEKCWFYNEHADTKKLVAIDFNQIAEKKISICDPFEIAEADIDSVIKQNNVEYLGTEVLDGRKCHIVRSWLVKIEHEATCSIIKWWFDSETYMPAKIVSDSGRWRVSHRFAYDRINEPIDDSEFRPGFVTKIEPQEPEPLDEDYNTRYIYIIDGSSSGRMSINWGKRGPKGTSGSGLN